MDHDQDQDLSIKDHDKDKDLSSKDQDFKFVLKDSLRTRTTTLVQSHYYDGSSMSKE